MRKKSTGSHPQIVNGINLNDVLRSITDGLIAIDKNYQVNIWNDAALELLGLPAFSLQGRSIIQVMENFPELDQSLMLKQLQKAMLDNTSFSTENYIEFGNRWFDIRIHPFGNGVFIYFKDVTSRKKQEILLEKLLNKEIAKQRMVARAVVDAQEKERAEIGKELHDNVNQLLSTAKLFLEVAKNNSKERLSLIKRSSHCILQAINEIRGISKALVPPSIGDLGLTESINDLAENIRLTKALEIEFLKQGEMENSVNDGQKLMLFRIVQEQVNNVLKHAQATKVSILLTSTENWIELVIIDDGKGFDLEHAHLKKGVGLSNIISRAEMFDGKVDIKTSSGAGCRLQVRIPLYH